MTLDAVFWPASMTEAITSAAALQLVERGDLQVDAAIHLFLPELRERNMGIRLQDQPGRPLSRPRAVQRLDDLMAEHILHPLKMTDTGFVVHK